MHYRIVDEYRLEWKWAPRSAPEPLDQSELAALIDGARVEGTEAGDLTDQLRESQVGVGIRQAACFVTVQSSVYHGLEAYYEWKAAVWLSRRREP
ncbi:MAG: hypothetical protein ABJD11_15730 [Gemmatimonadota bacterium]